MHAERWGKRVLRSMGYEMRRVQNRQVPAPPPLDDDPLAAVHLARGGTPVAFECPLEVVRDTQGFSFAAHGWHPLVAAMDDQQGTQAGRYAGSVLQRYFASFQPRNALEAIPGFKSQGWCGLVDLPPHLFGLTPWSAWDARRFDIEVRRWSANDAAEHGVIGYSLERHGVAYFGPASLEVSDLEQRRLRSVRASISSGGYDRRKGDCHVYLVRRGADFRAVATGGGRHRTSAMAALGHRFIPAQFHQPVAVDTRDVNEWPQVRSGIWSQRAALSYVDHLFDFDARRWAQERQLC